jgi:NADH-quinone oxidoreductase subunit N
MAVATKAAAFAIILRFFLGALLIAQDNWDTAMAVLATISILVGNVGAIGQTSLKRLLAWSGVAQAGYILAGVVVASNLGIKAVVFYLLVYLFMNVAAFAVVIARERETALGDSIAAVEGLGPSRPLLAWPLTISMLALAGLPGTAGFIGKFFLIEATVDGDFTWLGVAIVVGTMISLAYYLRVVAAMWMRPTAIAVPAIAGGSPDADVDLPRRAGTTEAVIVAVACAAASIFFGIIPSPLLDLAAGIAS